MAKLEGELTDFAPFVAIMQMVTEEFGSKSFDDPKVRKAWCRVIERLQADTSLLEHNRFIPCRRCNQEFEPVVGEKLLTLFLKWRERRTSQNLVAIYLCPACGGQIEAKQARIREEDEQGLGPETIADDEQWADRLIEEYGF
jgi:hypothetical protein